jgi:hypothetical protein
VSSAERSVQKLAAMMKVEYFQKLESHLAAWVHSATGPPLEATNNIRVPPSATAAAAAAAAGAAAGACDS